MSAAVLARPGAKNGKHRYTDVSECRANLSTLLVCAAALVLTSACSHSSSPLPAEVMVDGSLVTLVREREGYDDLTVHERSPRILIDGAGGGSVVTHSHTPLGLHSQTPPIFKANS